MRRALLEEDSELGSGLATNEFVAASRVLRVEVAEVDRGEWRPPRQQPDGEVGYLLLKGKLLREVRVRRDWNAELLLKGDVLRPWMEDSASFMQARWTALEPSRLGCLDTAAVHSLAQFPPLLDSLVERSLRRSRSLAAHAAIGALNKVEDRLLLLFWHLAERCGDLEDGRVLVRIRLTHDELSRLVGARRPTVTTSLMVLARRGELAREDDAWVLRGDPPTPPAAEGGHSPMPPTMSER